MKKLTLLYTMVLFSVSLIWSQNLIAVLPLENDEDKGITEILTNKLSSLGAFVVIEKSQIDKLIAEGEYQASQVDMDYAVLLANQVGASQVILGQITSLNDVEKLTIRLVDVEKAVVLGSAESLIHRNDSFIVDEQLLTLSENLTISLSDIGYSISEMVLSKILAAQENRKTGRIDKIEDNIKSGMYDEANVSILAYLDIYGNDNAVLKLKDKLEKVDIEDPMSLGLGAAVGGSLASNVLYGGGEIKFTMLFNRNFGIAAAFNLYISDGIGASFYGGPYFYFNRLGIYPFVGYEIAFSGQGVYFGLGMDLTIKKIAPFIEVGFGVIDSENPDTGEIIQENDVYTTITAGVSLRF